MASKHYLDQIAPYDGRKYTIQDDYYGYKTITDVTQYQQEGTAFGAADVNETCILTCDHTKSGTTHKLSTPNVDCKNIRFTATSNYKKGDLVMLNNEYVTAMTIDDEPLGDNYFTLNSVVVCFRVGSVLYFMSHNKGAEIKLLWKNASPGSSFAAQTLRIPEAVNYDYIIINADRREFEDAACTLLINKNSSGYMSGLQVYKESGWGMYAFSRYCKFTGENIQFEDANEVAFYTTATPVYEMDNKRLIPLTIMGVKL